MELRDFGGKRLYTEIPDTYRLIQLFSCHAQGQIRSCLQKPFHQGDAAVLNFQAGDAAWMDAAPGIEVGGIRISGHGAVGVPCDEQFLFLDRPGCQALFCLLFLCIIAGSAGRVGYAKGFQRFPEIPHQKAG